jgi:uncharacterized protein with NRDE domain
MCLYAFSWNDYPGHKLVLVANRDEFFERPSLPLHLWDEGFYSGKDLRAGGAWLGVHPNGKFAALTNYRNMRKVKSNAKSRGNLVKDFLEGDLEPVTYLQTVAEEMDAYEGFNLLVGEGEKLYYFSNVEKKIRELSPGLYGLSNELLESPWPKLKKAKHGLKEKLAADTLMPNALMEAVHSREFAKDEELPDTGMDLESERLLSPQFISARGVYGTISTTVILWKSTGEVTMVERTFDQPQDKFSDTQVDFVAIPADLKFKEH